MSVSKDKKKILKKKSSSLNKDSKKEAKKTKTKAVLKKTPKKEPQTMEELFQMVGYKLHGLKRGQTIKGLITSIDKKQILVDIGAKTEGLVVNKEFDILGDYIKELEVGSEIESIVSSPENDKGQILLSLRQTAVDFKWNLFTNYQEISEAIKVRGLEVNKGGVIARHRGIRGFVPASQFGRSWLGRLNQLQNKIFAVKVIEVDRVKNRLIFSEKLVSEEKAIKGQKQALKLVKTGGEYQGTVSGIMPFGVFVRVNIESPKNNKDKKKTSTKDGSNSENKESLFLEGLVHISEISWQKVQDLNRLFQIGQGIKVKVISINEKTAKLNLSIKQLQVDPWQNLVKKYKKDTKVKGEVSKLAAFGAFVILEEGVEGLLHISKIPADYNVKIGQAIDVYIESIDPEKKKISLGLVLKTKPVGYK